MCMAPGLQACGKQARLVTMPYAIAVVADPWLLLLARFAQVVPLTAVMQNKTEVTSRNGVCKTQP
jgi:hypothetical protein